MTSDDLSCVSSLKEDETPLYVQPHYKESYRLAIYALLCGGKDAYEEFLRAEHISHLLSEEEILFILENAELPEVEDEVLVVGVGDGKKEVPDEGNPSTYFPTESDDEVPDLDMGWPEVGLEGAETSISLLFHPPRENTPSIKDVVRKQIQEARLVIAIAMDIFTDVDIFKELISATLRGVVVYILLDVSHYKSFLSMTRRVGINIQDFKNIRVRIVQGQLYQCQSGMKFSGGLQQKFILVDCRTVLYGTYSYTWTFEKINLSMVLVVTGQLVGSYDEEFRRLYARSLVAPVQCKEKLSAQYLRDIAQGQNQVPLPHMDMRTRMMRGFPDDRYNNTAMMTRGLSVQDRLHQSHCNDMGNMLRGYSYGGELQNLNSMTRLRMGTKDIPLAPDRSGFNMREGGGDMQPTNRMSPHHLRHLSRYGADQNMIPFNSETSLHKWKMDTYLSDDGVPLDASCDALSPMASPYSSYTGLNEHHMQQIHSRSRDMMSRVEEMRQKRLSLQEYTHFRHSQEALRSAYQTPERLKTVSSLRSLEMRQTVAEQLEQNTPNGHSPEPANQKDSETNNQAVKREQILSDAKRSASHYDVNNVPDRKPTQAYDWHEPLSKTSSAADLEMKLNDPSLKLSHLQPSGMQHPRAMESLTEIPEEKEGSRVNSSETAFKAPNEEIPKNDKTVKPVSPVESHPQDQKRRKQGSVGKVANSTGPSAPRERKKSTSSEVQTVPRSPTPATPEPQLAAEARGSPSPSAEDPNFKRKNSLRKKVQALLSSDDKKGSKKEKSLQRKASLRSSKSDHSQKGQPESASSSQNSLVAPTDTAKPKSPFPRLSPQRSSKKKSKAAAEPDSVSSSTLTLDSEVSAASQRGKVYSRFEYFLNTDILPQDKLVKLTSMNPSEKDRSTSLNRQDCPAHQAQNGSDNKLGRFMQRVGSLMNKNK